jgi:hypothetical protein
MMQKVELSLAMAQLTLQQVFRPHQLRPLALVTYFLVGQQLTAEL